MSVSYTCPNAGCGVTLKTPNPVPAGKRVKCPKCSQMFTPVPGGNSKPQASGGAGPAGPGTFKFVEEEEKKKPAKKQPPKAEPPPTKKPTIDDEDEDPEVVKRGYGVVKDSQQEIDEAEKNKPKFGQIQEKFKKSARGPAVALLVMPVNLLTFEGLVTAAGGITMFVIGMWPLVFNDAPPGDEETEEAIVMMLLGCMTFAWGAFICFGASQMQELSSYLWAMAGAITGVLPLLVGIYAIIMLQNPKVKAGFEEHVGALDEDEKALEDEEKGSNRDADDEEEDRDDDDD